VGTKLGTLQLTTRNYRTMTPRPEKCIGNCKREISVGQTIFQVYEGGYWSSPYITPGRYIFLGNWCVECFHRDLGHLISSQIQPYSCTICERSFVEHEPVIYATVGTRPAAGYFRAEKRGDEVHVIACQDCWQDPRFEKLYRVYRLLS
jgi:hypothetical protein